MSGNNIHLVGNLGDTQMANPLHIQRFEAALDMAPFLSYAKKMLSKPLTSSDDGDTSEDSDSVSSKGNVRNYRKLAYCVRASRQDRNEDKRFLYNLTSVGPERIWLQNLLLSDTESDSEISDEGEYIRDMLKNHLRERKYRRKYHSNPTNSEFGYYGSGLLSNHDMFPEHQHAIVGVRKRKFERKKRISKLKPGRKKTTKHDSDDRLSDVDWEEQLAALRNENDDDLDSKPSSPTGTKLKRGRRTVGKTPEMMAARRRKLWQLMAKKELGKVQRAKSNNHKDMVTNCRRVASLCMKVSRQKAMQSQKLMKETIWRAKRLTREMQGYWKRYDRVERETRKRMEREAEEQRKIDVEMVEAKRQQRKLNFLITQTELYAHFMSKKLGNVSKEEQLKILSQLDEECNPRLASIDNYDSGLMKQQARKNAMDAFNSDRARKQMFDNAVQQHIPTNQRVDASGHIIDLPQPTIFRGCLKGYQLKGMTWLANLYDQGISGILADEMGLGKTVQSIAFLCHIAESYGVWGPFLIISPASTLHNWQQEMERFVPDFNVVPYWGSPNERKILRQFWEQKDLHTKGASFHVVITSYQLVVSDYKYFNRIKWQYMVLDEAQAIKSSSSVRWKLLLGFNCRNRLLLSGTPIQNSMAELWALLHFIMPTLFDSHEEFNEWFSKDIESHAENKTGIDEKQISRLHMILKPFMLRRIKKDVENELSDKIEIMVYCPLTTRQKLLYVALKKKIRIEDLLHLTGHGSGDGHSFDKNFTSNLMNLVMQFRKVCNHPELFERRDAKSPFFCNTFDYRIARLIFNEAFLGKQIPSMRHIVHNRFNIFKCENVHRSVIENNDGSRMDYVSFQHGSTSNTFSFTRLCSISPIDMEKLALGGLIHFFQHLYRWHEYLKLLHYRWIWWKRQSTISSILLEPTIEQWTNTLFSSFHTPLNDLIFTATSQNTIYAHTQQSIHSMQETIEHRILRSRKMLKLTNAEKQLTKVTNSMDFNNLADLPVHFKDKHGCAKPTMVNVALLPEFEHTLSPVTKLECWPTEMPRFVYGLIPRVVSSGRKQYCESREAAWTAIRHEHCDSEDGLRLVMNAIQLSYPSAIGWSNIIIPDKQTLVSDAGKLAVLDSLLTRLKAQGHRVLIYSQMTKMIDLLEEYMWHRKHRYMRLDGSSKISARRDMVADFQNRADIFVFLLSTRAGGLGINLTAADTVIFYDSDWNPTVDQQAMDRAHRLGQTKQVTVYRLICKGTIEERILQRAREKSEIQRMVITGANFKPDTLKPKEVVSLLLDDEEIELKYRQKTEERKFASGDILRNDKDRERKRKPTVASIKVVEQKRPRVDGVLDADDLAFLESGALSPTGSEQSNTSVIKIPDSISRDDSSSDDLIADCDSTSGPHTPVSFLTYDGLGKQRKRHNPRGTKRGRPRGSRRGGLTISSGRIESSAILSAVREMIERQTAENLRIVLEEEMSFVGIKYEQVIAVAHDNGANMLAAVKNLKMIMHCCQNNEDVPLCSILPDENVVLGNYDAKDDDYIESEDDDEQYSDDDSDSSCFNDDFDTAYKTVEQLTGNAAAICDTSNDSDLVLLESIRCGAHTAQLAVWDVIKPFKTRLHCINK
ncbi:chromatin-remodeling ATPase INO80 isoform X2 [Topomyia yanbarensis]|uniref:chromatin-remodeling ATPase INO80 isoform X2 n=1 Tax=Topomyia yanbarensis TaxID=2498891 RepID=UPI00273AF336|nr:chromatin-remodeling ATPase INO80 isoform X2 [Topomyia yanbarensis]